MELKLKYITATPKNMHYLDVIDWIKDNALDIEHEVINTSYYFISLNEKESEDDLVTRVKKRVKAIIRRYEENDKS